MPKHVVISDASTLIGLENIQSLEILQELYGQLKVTNVVEEEVAFSLPDWIEVKDDYDKEVYHVLQFKLDAGEASAIALALAEKEATLLIIDEQKGRKQAKALGLKITGLVGVIIKAKKEGFITSGKEKLDQLLEKGFRLSPKIYELALMQMDEG